MIRNILFIIFIGFIGYLSFFKPSPGVFNTFTFSAIAPKDCNGTCCNGLIPPLCVEPAFKGFFIENIVFLFIHYVIIALFGYTLIKPFWANTGFCYGLVSSFFIGYIAVIPIIRVLSLFFPYTMIYIPVMVTVLSIIAILEREFIASWPNFRQQQFQLSRYLKHIAWILSFTIFLFGALSILLRQGAFAWVGHGNDQYAFLLEQWRQSPPAHFPLIDKHYDELIFHYFLTSSFQTVPNPVIIWWLTLGLIKTSMLALFISLFKRLNISSFFPILFTTFIFIGTTSLIATKYYMLLDSSNLLFFTVHSGRIIGIAIIALLLVNSLKDNKDTKSIPPLALILIGLGITSTSISNAIWLLLVSAWMILLRISPKEQPATNRTLLSGQLLCYTSTISLLLMYGLPFSKPFYMVRAVAVGISCLLFLWYAFEYIKPTNKPAIHSQAIIILSILLGLIFLGNVWVNNPIRSNTYKHISTLALETPIYLLPPYKGHRAEPGFKGTWALGDYREKGPYNEYCKGLVPFIAYYGWILILIPLTNHLFYRQVRRNMSPSPQDSYLYSIFLLAVVGLPLFLLFTDFIDFTSRAWIKTRFLEFPIYFIFIISFYFIYRFTSKWQKIIVALILLTYTVVPFLKTQRPRQIMHDAQAIINTWNFKK